LGGIERYPLTFRFPLNCSRKKFYSTRPWFIFRLISKFFAFYFVQFNGIKMGATTLSIMTLSITIKNATPSIMTNVIYADCRVILSSCKVSLSRMSFNQVSRRHQNDTKFFDDFISQKKSLFSERDWNSKLSFKDDKHFTGKEGTL